MKTKEKIEVKNEYTDKMVCCPPIHESGHPGISPVLAQQVAGLAGPNSKNSGNLIIILKSEGTGDGLGYCFGKKSYMTVHGSISKAETNIPFVMFYPGDETTYSKKTEITYFLGNAIGFDCNTGNCFTTDIMNIVNRAVLESNEIFLQPQ